MRDVEDELTIYKNIAPSKAYEIEHVAIAVAGVTAVHSDELTSPARD